MKQKFDLKLTIKGDGDRTKALTVAAKMTGVISVMIGGRDKNILTVIGNEVDIVALSRSLAKKLGSATVVSVLPLHYNGGYDQEQAETPMGYYEGRSNNYNGDYSYSQPKYSYYNNPPVPQYSSLPPPHQTNYYLCEKPDDEYPSCSIM